MSLDKSKLNKDTFCMAPWIEAHFSVQKNILPCCIYNMDYSFGNLNNSDDVVEIYNSDIAKEVRKSLFNGIKHEACKSCWLSEEISTNDSYRINHNKMYKRFINESLENTNEDFSLKKVTLRRLDIRFDNKCNLKCRICTAEYSTSWYSDNKEIQKRTKHLGHIDLSGNIYKQTVSENVYSFILSQLTNVDEIFFAGGEPLIQDKHYEILNKLIDLGISKNVAITYNTNFTKLKYRDYDVLDIWKNFRVVNVCASLDDSHERGEFQRKNMVWEDVINNVKLLKEKGTPNISFSIIPTLSSLNVYNLPNFHKEWIELGYITYNDFFVNILWGPDWYDVKNLPNKNKKEVIKIYQDYINYLQEIENSEVSVEEFKKCISYIKKEGHTEKMEAFENFNKTLDELRNENLLKVLPEYKNLYIKNVI
jgi:molybdenum cofactor biosynthesis enzyme MoaA